MQKAVREAARLADLDKRVNCFQGKFVNGENAGLDDEGFAARWLELHPEDAVIMRDGSTRTAT